MNKVIKMKKTILIVIGVLILFSFAFLLFENDNSDSINSHVVQSENNNSTNDTGGKTVDIESKTPSNGNDDADNADENDDVVEMHIDESIPPKTEEEKKTVMKDEQGKCAIKGYTGDNGVKVAILPDNDFYDIIESDELFCTINDAEEKGYIDYGRQLYGDEEARKQGVIAN